jgi:hypothetical protein
MQCHSPFPGWSSWPPVAAITVEGTLAAAPVFSLAAAAVTGSFVPNAGACCLD